MHLKYISALLIFLGLTGWFIFQDLSLMQELKHSESLNRTQSQEIQDLKAQLTPKSAQNIPAPLPNALPDLKSQLANETAILDQMLQNLSALKAKTSDSQIADLQAQRVAKRESIELLKKQLADWKQQARESQNGNQTANLEDQQTKLGREHGLDEQIAAQDFAIKNLNSSLANLRKQKRTPSIDAQMQDLQSRLQIAQYQLGVARTERKNLTQEYAFAQSKSRLVLREDNQKATSNEQSLNLQIQNETSDLKKIDADLQNRMQALRSAQEAFNMKQKEITQQKAKILDLQNRQR